MLPEWLLPTAMPWMRIKGESRNVLVGEERTYNLSPANRANRARNLMKNTSEVKRRASARKAALSRWARIPTL